MDDILRYLAGSFGIQLQYQDFWGGIQHARVDSLRAILEAMGVKCGSAEEAQRSLDQIRVGDLERGLAPTLFYPDYASYYQTIVTFPEDQQWGHIHWKLYAEQPGFYLPPAHTNSNLYN